MKILAISDEIVDRIYNANVRETYPDVRLILGCGDLPYTYLEFLVTIYNVQLLYVPGNHDPHYDLKNPRAHAEGCTNLDGQITQVGGLLVAGLGGSIRYNPGGPNQYSQAEMFSRAFQLLSRIWLKTLVTRRQLDVLITHSPPAGIHDDTDPAHLGLRALNFILRVAKPAYMLHGHTVFYKHNINSHISQYHQTQVVNIYPFRLMDIDL